MTREFGGQKIVITVAVNIADPLAGVAYPLPGGASLQDADQPHGCSGKRWNGKLKRQNPENDEFSIHINGRHDNEYDCR
ncbi:MAG: hypothetical protein PHR28_08900 [candidate division Zixibacteria bacterium]|nr:hypothetical protein [candidate division Zixibacteria bacterium]